MGLYLLEILYCIHCRLIKYCESLLHKILSAFTFHGLQQCGYAQLHVTDVILWLLILRVQTNLSNTQKLIDQENFNVHVKCMLERVSLRETVMIHAQHRRNMHGTYVYWSTFP